MLLRTCGALLMLLAACATTDPNPGELEDPSPRFANLQRAAKYPWTDDGHCVMREASNEWPILEERCYQALDHDRVKFRDLTGRCAVASTGAAAGAVGVGLCVFLAPEIIVGAIIVTGVVVVAVVIKEELDAYERNASRERAKPETQMRPTQEPSAKGKPKPEGSTVGKDWPKVKLPEIQREARLAKECGYDFVVGVKSTAHQKALEKWDDTLTVVVMDWC